MTGATWRGLILLVAALLGTWSECWAQEPASEPTAPLWMARFQKVAIDSRDEELVRLQKERYNAAAHELAAAIEMYSRAFAGPAELLRVYQRLAAAGAELWARPADRVKYYASAWEVAKVCERVARQKEENGVASLHERLSAQTARLTAEIELQRARTAAGQPLAGAAPLARLLSERHETATKEAEAWREVAKSGRVPLAGLTDVERRLVRAGIEMDKTPAHWMKHLQAGLEKVREVESWAQAAQESGIGSRGDWLHPQQLRFDLEIELQRLQSRSGSKPNAALTSLLDQRYQGALDEVGSQESGADGTEHGDGYFAALQQLAKASAGAATSPADKAQRLQVVLEKAREVEKTVGAKAEIGAETLLNLQRSKYERLTAEIAFVRARDAAKQGEAPTR